MNGPACYVQPLVTAFMLLQPLTHEALSSSHSLVPTTGIPMALLLFLIHHDQEARNIKVTRIMCKTRDSGYEQGHTVHEFTDKNIWMLGTLTQAGWHHPASSPGSLLLLVCSSPECPGLESVAPL